MNRDVRVLWPDLRRLPKHAPNVARIYFAPDPELELRDQLPDMLASRIMMGVVPMSTYEDAAHRKHVSPAYACVIAEVYDGDPRQKARRRVVLDESVSLDPADFSEDERDRWDIHPAGVENPTLDGLRRGLVALKDLYRPTHCVIPPPEDSAFYRIVRDTDGLSGYDMTQKQHFLSWFPFYKCDVKTEKGWTEPTVSYWVPEVYDVEINRQICDNLLALQLLQISDSADGEKDPRRPCKLFHTRPQWHPSIRTCIGMILGLMQDTDETYSMRDWRVSESGYRPMAEVVKEERQLYEEETDSQIEQLMWMAGEAVDAAHELEAEIE